MAKKETKEEIMCWEEHITHAMRSWMSDYAGSEGFRDFPLEDIRIDVGKVDRAYFEIGAMRWVFKYYKNHRPIVKNQDRAYRKVTRWLLRMTPTLLMQMNTREAFEVLCCRVWTLFVTEEYGMF